MAEFLKVFFPALMVVGAAGSLVTNLCTYGGHALNLQWLGATLLYLGLMMRNIGG